MARVRQRIKTRTKKVKGGGKTIPCNMCKGTGRIRNWRKKG